MASYRSRIHTMLVKAMRYRRQHLEHVHFGAPAELAAIERVEREVIGGPMDPALRAFFLEMNGLQLAYWDTGEPADGNIEIVPAQPGPLAWHVAGHAFGPLWKKIEAETGPGGWASLVCIPDLETMFGTDWERIDGLKRGEEVLFDAFHHYYGAYLHIDRTTRAQTVGLANDHWAARDHAEISVAEYLEQIVEDGGARRVFQERHADRMTLVSTHRGPPAPEPAPEGQTDGPLPKVIVFGLDDLPAALTVEIPASSPVRSRIFYLTSRESSTSGCNVISDMFDAIEYPDIADAEAGRRVATYVATIAQASFALTERIAPDLVPTRGRATVSVEASFHAADASWIRDYLDGRIEQLSIRDTLLESMRLFSVRTPDGTPLEAVWIESHTINVGLRTQLRSVGAHVFAVDATEEEHASFTLSYAGESGSRWDAPVASLDVQLDRLAPCVVHELVLLPRA